MYVNFTVTLKENDATRMKKNFERQAANLMIYFIPRINAFWFSQSTLCLQLFMTTLLQLELKLMRVWALFFYSY